MVGPLIASFAVAQLVSSPIWGKFSDRYGRRPAMLIGLGASAFAYVIFGYANSLWMLFASRIVQGLGAGPPRRAGQGARVAVGGDERRRRHRAVHRLHGLQLRHRDARHRRGRVG